MKVIKTQRVFSWAPAIVLSSVLLLGCAHVSTGDTEQHAARLTARLRDRLPSFDGVVRPSTISGLYEVIVDSQISYVTADGRYVIVGEVLDTESGRNITQSRRAALVQEHIAKVHEKYLLVYDSAPGAPTVTVFVDTDCDFCGRFVDDLQDLTSSGYRFRLLFYPRAGLLSESYKQAVAIWCSSDPKMALASYFRHQSTLSGQDVCPSPVFASYELAQKLKIAATPAFVLPDGRIFYGYRGANELRTQLDQALGGGPKVPTP